MRHIFFHKKLIRYLESDLPEKELRAVRSHLRRCSICREDLQTLQTLWQADSRETGIQVPPFLWTRVSARLQSKEKKGVVNGITGKAEPLFGAAAVIVFLLAGLIGGIVIGTRISLGPARHTLVQKGDMTDNFGLSFFDVLPPGFIDTDIPAPNEKEQ